MDEAYFRSLSLIMAKQAGAKKLAHQIIFNNSANRGEVANCGLEAKVAGEITEKREYCVKIISKFGGNEEIYY